MARNVVVTGGASGIGKATAKQFLELGDKVFLADYNEKTLKETYDEFAKTFGDKVAMKTLDVSKPAEVDALAADVKASGGCDVLVNNAAVFRVGLLHEAPMDDYDFQFDINVRGVFNTCKALAPQMLAKKKGAIVNVSSVSGMGGDYNMSLYCATKGAVHAMSRAMAMDYSVQGVRVNIVSPSAVKTPMFLTGASEAVLESFRKNMPDKRLCEPEHCANAIVFLASDAADHMCGVNLPVDGGLSAWNGQPNQEK
ncbi:MAG: SDR family oxidoreductase [Oscillospiraceae bacterium]|nr:SDR family oxidoreductase [Oscillospiraceae bacterium]MCL2277791.1 SDR family oxidoreductase [Oscillospiraceae bacterium]